MKFEDQIQRWPTTVVGALTYGAGMAIGMLVVVGLTALGVGGFLVSLLDESQVFLKLLVAMLLIVLIFGLAGGIGGGIGGYFLSTKLALENRRRFTWRSGWSLFIAMAIIILPVLAITTLFGFLNNDLELAIGKLTSLFMVFGLVYGIIAGLMIGLLIAGIRQTLGILLASAAGFAAGGWLLGLGLHLLMRSGVTGGLVAAGTVLLSFFLFGAFGGGGIGLAFRYVDRERTLLPPTRGWRIFRNVVLALILFVLLGAVGKLLDTIIVRQPDLARVLTLPTVGTHWDFSEEGVPIGEGASTPALAIGQDGTVTMAWSESGGDQSGVYYAQLPAGETAWSAPVQVAETPAPVPEAPRIAVDENGRIHVVWASEADGADTLYYSQCGSMNCTAPASLAEIVAALCPGVDGSLLNAGAFAVSTDQAGELLVAWAGGAGRIPYVQLSAAEGTNQVLADCLSLPDNLGQPGAMALASRGPDSYVLVMNTSGGGNEPAVVEWRLENGVWQNRPSVIGEGNEPALFVDSEGAVHQAWCGESGAVHYLGPDGNVTQLESPACIGRPALAQDREGKMHLVWSSEEVRRMTGDMVAGSFLYEQIQDGETWSEAAIIAQPPSGTAAVLAGDANGVLHLSWADETTMAYGSQTPYECVDPPETAIGQVIYDVVRQEKFRPASDPVPYCHNRFEKLVFTPNPQAPEVYQLDNPNAAFDDVANLVRSAKYEALFATMQWDAPSENGGPGATLAAAIAELYATVKANPEQYPRGMTVRILLGNVPELAIFEPITQVYHVFQDLQDAGVTEMRDDEIGWRLEIADYGGIWPHMHTKFAVADGRTALAGGFNFGFLHLPLDHPSGKGYDMSDKGIQVSGPVAQSVLAAYDDLWAGADFYDCSRFPPPIPRLQFLWCRVKETPTDHPPEVLRFDDHAGDTNAFALHHTAVFLESDEAVLAAIGNAQETIDLAEVNFSMDTVCIAAMLLTDLCNSEELVPPYMQALLQAVAENDVKVRVIVEATAMNGFENRIGIMWLYDELDKIGKRDNVEIKFYNGKMHDKAQLYDDEFLIVGSQNFHYSAWGENSLTEYNIATEDPQAIEDFKTEYDYHWERGIPADEQMLSENNG